MKSPSVTKILSPYIDKTWFTDESRERGSAVHAACACWLQGLWAPKLKPEYQLYLDSFQRWADQMIDTVILVETRLYDADLGFNGKPDLITILKGDKLPSLLDLKTGQAQQNWWVLQDSAYRHLAKKDKGIICYRGLSIRPKKDGSGCLIDEHPRDYKRAFNIFLGLLNAHRFFNNEKEVKTQ